MKSLKSALFAFAIIVSGTVYSQSAQDYAALAEFLPAEKLSSLQESDASYAKIAILNRHAYYLGDPGPKDVSMFSNVSEIAPLYPNMPTITTDLIESRHLNLIGYNFKLKQNEYLYFRIANSDKILVILPIDLCIRNFNSETE